MFREMRRKRQALTQAQCQAILEQGSCGVLALSGDGGYPYAVPLSYLYHQGKLYFHCAKSGHKLDAPAPGAQGLLLRGGPGPGGAPGVHHPLPQRHRLRQAAGAGGRQREACRHRGPGPEVRPPGHPGPPGGGHPAGLGAPLRAGADPRAHLRQTGQRLNRESVNRSRQPGSCFTEHPRPPGGSHPAGLGPPLRAGTDPGAHLRQAGQRLNRESVNRSRQPGSCFTERPAHREEAIRRDWAPLCVLELTPEHISGKQGKDLIGKA